MFKKVALTSAIAVGTAQAGLFDIFETPETRKDNILWWIDGIKGFSDGFHLSLYGSVDDACLTPELQDWAVEINEDYKNPYTFWWLDFSKDTELNHNLVSLADNYREHCSVYRLYKDLETFCRLDKAKCSDSAMSARFTQNMFKYIGQDIDLMALILPSDDKDQLASQMNKLGSDLGGFLNDVFEFDYAPVLEYDTQKKVRMK